MAYLRGCHLRAVSVPNWRLKRRELAWESYFRGKPRDDAFKAYDGGPDCAHRSCAACAGLMSISRTRRASCALRQRADRRNKIGSPKSARGQRTVPLPPTVVSELRQWKLRCPKHNGKLGLVFPNGQGNPEYHGNIVGRWLKPTIMAAKVTMPVLDAHGNPKHDQHGKPIVKPKHTGWH